MPHSCKSATDASEPGIDAPRAASDLVARLDTAAGAIGRPSLRVGVLLWPRFPLLSLAGLCDALRHAADVGDQSRPVRCTWQILGVPGTRVASSCGIEVPVQAGHSLQPGFDYIAVIGGLLSDMARVESSHARFVQHCAAERIPLLGICTGSFVLARLGLMQGHTACVHPFHVDDWRREFPHLPFVADRHFLRDGQRITCAGGLSVVELAAELVRSHCGPDLAAKVVHQMTVNESGNPSQIARCHALGYTTADNDVLRRAIVLMEKNLATPLEIAVVARLLACSTRQLERVFVAETGQSPSDYYRLARLKYARWLLTTTDLPIMSIAYECGFSDASHLIRHFRQAYGMSPGRLRKALQIDPAAG
jgi:transcriptional regulator GlxA family with amidase domain